MTPDRTDPALQGADGNGAYADQQARIAADIATMRQGPTEHAAGLTDHHEGRPTIAEQMLTHVPPPHAPDTGGHQSAADPIT